MDENEKMIICEIAEPKLRNKLLELYQKDKTVNLQNECKVLIGHDFNYSHEDMATVIVTLVTTDGTKVIETIQGENSTGCLDLTSVLQDNGYKVVHQN